MCRLDMPHSDSLIAAAILFQHQVVLIGQLVPTEPIGVVGIGDDYKGFGAVMPQAGCDEIHFPAAQHQHQRLLLLPAVEAVAGKAGGCAITAISALLNLTRR